MISRVESTSPPGVRSVNTTSAAWAASARFITSIMNSAETGWMMLSMSAETTGAAFCAEIVATVRQTIATTIPIIDDRRWMMDDGRRFMA